MGKPIMKVWDSTQQKYVSVPAVKGSKGDAGTTPHIGANGNWYLGENDTGVKAAGPAGTPGKNGSDASVTTANIANALGYTPRKAWYVTVTQTASGSAYATADKTPQEVFSAYQAGYAVYARVNFVDQMAQSILPLEVAQGSEDDGIILGFATTGQVGEDGDAITAGVLCNSLLDVWNVWKRQLAKTDDIPDIPTALPNPNVLTIKIGSTTMTYDGSSAQTVEIGDGTEVSY